METIRRFPETFDPELLERAEMVTEVTVAPETLMRGFFRRPTGPGWALVGDACYFKHPGTAQGIGDAVEAALYVADSLSGDDPGTSTDTSPGATARRPSTTTGPSPGAGSPGLRARSRCSEAGRPIRTPARTCGIASPARSSPPG